jgi:Zn-dependent peptidase ImmA (M78 family)
MSRSSIAPFNSEIFQWALKDLNISEDNVAEKLKVKKSKILEWLNDVTYPTYNQLESIAYKITHLPLAVFFLPEPPAELSVKKNFRSIPENVYNATGYKTRLAVRRADFLRSVLYDVFENNPSDSPIFKNIILEIKNDIEGISKRIRKYLNLTIEIQESFTDYYKAFNWYRETFEEAGIFTFQLQFEDARAFCLLDKEFPLIVLNSGDYITSKIFSLFHELSHILVDTDDILNEEESSHQAPIEIFCNKLASEILVPSKDLLTRFSKYIYPLDDENIEMISKKYKVSKYVIVRKLLDNGLIKEIEYSKYVTQMYSQVKESSGGGGSYYTNKISALGKTYINKVLESYNNGKIGELEVTNYLNIKLDNLGPLEQKLTGNYELSN